MNTKNLKPFDLKAALRGEPVILRNGSKAYIRHHETELTTGINEEVLGYLEGVGVWGWSVDGESHYAQEECKYDIIGMYPKTRIINGFEVPAPETTEPDKNIEIYLPSPIAEYLYRQDYWCSHSVDKIRLERGLVFLNKEDAVANATAMLGIDPYKENIDAGSNFDQNARQAPYF